MSPWRSVDGALVLAVRVTPRAKKTALAGIGADADGRPHLAIRLAAPPVDGAANDALIRFLAADLGLPRSAVRIVAGDTSRIKQIRLEGATEADLKAWLAP